MEDLLKGETLDEILMIAYEWVVFGFIARLRDG